MAIEVNVNFNFNFPQLVGIIQTVIAELVLNRQQQESIMATLDELTNEVHNNSNLIDSARTLIQSLADQVAANMNNPQALQALVDELRQKDTELAQAIAAGTPQDPNAGGGGSDTTGGGGDTTGGATA